MAWQKFVAHDTYFSSYNMTACQGFCSAIQEWNKVQTNVNEPYANNI